VKQSDLDEYEENAREKQNQETVSFVAQLTNQSLHGFEAQTKKSSW
jgi:hypothetical protein